MAGQHGASPKFHSRDNMDAAIRFAAEDSDVDEGQARRFLATFFRQWAGPRGPQTSFMAIADRIDREPDHV